MDDAQVGTLIAPTDFDVGAALDAYERGDAGNAGIVDLVSIMVMRRLGMREVFSCEAHFQAAGMKTLF
jgi:predicted nucleic acid-binding protein